MVLDRDLPKVHGDDVCRALVASSSRSRILMLTAADTIEDRVEGLSLGADDYLPKPFAFAELVARIRALARRSARPSPPSSPAGDIRLDPARRTATRAGRRLELSPREFALLETLLAAEGAPLTAEELLRASGTSSPTRSATSSRSPSPGCGASSATRPRSRPSPAPATASAHDPLRVACDGSALHLPQPTIRLRFTLLYSGLFLACGLGLLAITYLLLAHKYGGDFFAVPEPAGSAEVAQAAPNGSAAQAVAQAQAQKALGQLPVQFGIALAIMTALSVASPGVSPDGSCALFAR